MAPFATSTITSTPSTESEQWVHYHAGGIPGRRQVLTGADAKQTFTSIPRIDMRRVFSPNLSDRKELAVEVGSACRDVGFFYAVNHGVDEEVLKETFDAVKRYFDLAKEVKMECHNQKTERFRGYEAFLEGKLDPTTGGDLKEGFLMGEDATDPEQDRPAPPPTYKPRNQWPRHPSALYFRPALYRYYSAVFTFAQRMLSLFALALDLPEDHFSAISSNPMTNIRALHYPPQENDSDVGIGAHTDFVWFTLVCQSATRLPALEVLNANSIWVPVHFEPNSFVVNIGDFLKMVTDGTWQSTVHRVRNMGGEERYSMPFFFSPDEDAVVGVLEKFRREGVKYEDVRVGDYFQRRLDVDRTTHLEEGEGRRAGF